MDFTKIEEKILKFWEKKKIFEKSIFQRKGKPFFSFYDGPPFATGKPHYGHILATTIKDTVLRYWTMRGYQVPRRVGWDCHGLPVENLIEKELGIKNKKDIESYGIEKFNSACRNSVFRCVKDFQETLKRVGRWADYKNAYATLDNNYIESVWWVFKKLWELGLVDKDYRVCPYCPRCGTPLSNFEVNIGYKEVEEDSIFLKFQIKNSKLDNAFILVWTTTPWTLPANTALAVNPKAWYCLIKEDQKSYILAEKRKFILNSRYQISKRFLGKDLLRLQYEPLFDFLVKRKIKNSENVFQILPADFVSLEEGTGVVHIAPMYGEEDFQLGKKFNLPLCHLVDENGCFKEEAGWLSGKFIKDADQEIINDLSQRNILYKKEKVFHSYPFCWRCDTPLLYYAIDSWYIRVTKIKKQLIENNKKIHWVPAHVKEGRFGKWLKEAKDWAFSRNRFWGAPIPIWVCGFRENSQSTQKCENIKVIGSIKELEKLGNKKIKDLHRPYIDEISFKCEKCKGTMKRIPEVFDCWFESGSMPYAQWHYPFENKKLVENTFPADFIAEGLDQTRGWFYTLHVLATALTLKNIGLGKAKPAFKNVIVNGLILDSQGRKLSKKLRNYPEPKEIFENFGADALRYFLLTSTPIGEDYRFSSQGVQEVWRKIITTLWHSYLFFQTYKDNNFKPQKTFQPKSFLDKWIISRLQNLTKEVIFWMDQYEITKAGRFFNDFIDDLSNWYIRRSRRKFQKPEKKEEKNKASQTLYYLLINLSKLTAPFLPFISEEIYRGLRTRQDPISVHLCDFTKPKKKLINKQLEEKMKIIRDIVSFVLAERAEKKIKIRQPLSTLKVKKMKVKIEKELLDLIKEEVNVKEIIFDSKIQKEIELDTKITPQLKEEGVVREIIRYLQEMRKRGGLKPKNKILIYYFGDIYFRDILEKNRKLFLSETGAKNFFFQKNDGLKIEKNLGIDGKKLWLGIRVLR